MSRASRRTLVSHKLRPFNTGDAEVDRHLDEQMRDHTAQVFEKIRYFDKYTPDNEITKAEIDGSATPTDFTYLPGHVLRYGADPTGATDSTTAFQAALNAVQFGGTVIIPTGTFLLSTGLKIPGSGIQIGGAGKWSTILKWAGSAGAVFSMLSTASANSYCKLEDFAIVLSNSADIGIDATSLGLSVFSNLRIWGSSVSLSFTASVGGAAAGTLTAAIANGTYVFIFANGEMRTVTIAGGTGATWAGVLLAGTITTALIQNGTGILLASSASAYTNDLYSLDIQNCIIGIRIHNGANEQRFFGGQVLSCTTGLTADSTGASLSDDIRIFGMRFENNITAINISDWNNFLIVGCRLEKSTGGTYGVYYSGGSASLYPLLLINNLYASFSAGNAIFNNAATGTILQIAESPYDYQDNTGTGTRHIGLGKLTVGNPGGTGGGTIQSEDSTGNAALNLSGQGNGAVKAQSGFVTSLSTVTYSASMTPNAIAGNHFIITATNGTAFTINSPSNLAAAQTGQRFTIEIRNTSGGALGAATWNAAYKMSAWTNPANGFSRSIDFLFDGTNLIQVSQTGVDVPN